MTHVHANLDIVIARAEEIALGRTFVGQVSIRELALLVGELAREVKTLQAELHQGWTPLLDNSFLDAEPQDGKRR